MSVVTHTPIVAAAAATLTLMLVGRIGLPDPTRKQPGGPTVLDAPRPHVLAAGFVSQWTTRRRRRRDVPPDAVATWCDAVARAVRSGHTLRSALEVTRPTHRELDDAAASLRDVLGHGRPLEVAVAAWAPDRRHGPHVELARAVLLVVARLGGPPAAPLQRVASALRARAADGHDRAAQSAQARLSAHVLTAVPLGVLALLVAVDPDVGHVLSTPVGVTCLVAGLGANLLGWWWMRRILGGPA